ncbi:sodium:proton symporter [Acuticoccus sp. M5D2P5]|uniref:sodium:proton symporter n=1 Tax=Acuticoccus kalidii TaxID=2910977 RepID=UPI001F17472D|nr:sodium:proton symporter [Acuticoccus kalidii]MCF3935117.1 sodium:proton symporter [Acuticoccus kalidii]
MGLFAFISRNGTRIIALSAIVGILFPTFAGTVRPYLGYCVMVMLCVSLLRVDLTAFVGRMRRPQSAAVAALWTSVVFPLIVLSLALAWGPPASHPLVLAVLFLFAAPSPIVSAPAFAMLMGLDGALVLAVTLISTIAIPISAPVIASLFVADQLPISALDLAVRLAVILGAASLAAFVLRRFFGARRIAAGKTVFDTISVAIAMIFALGAMDGVSEAFFAAPVFTVLAGLGALGFALVQTGIAYALFRPFVGADAIAIAYAAGNRNSGLMVAALGTMQIDDTVWLFFALGQLPIFLFPLLLQPLGQRLAAGPREAPA